MESKKHRHYHKWFPYSMSPSIHIDYCVHCGVSRWIDEPYLKKKRKVFYSIGNWWSGEGYSENTRKCIEKTK